MTKILLIEDDEAAIKLCLDTVERMKDEDPLLDYEIISIKTVGNAENSLRTETYNGAIVDIRLWNSE